ncbi:DUF6286 domain-containing protein [Kitasatospora sp. NPDC059571]|uniref:DUF6286 domain-containing protein n=1 Tax=Kitasatospora sp. NPDC059571 TaxID=3346871 RepID=UPI00369A9A1E
MTGPEAEPEPQPEPPGHLPVEPVEEPAEEPPVKVRRPRAVRTVLTAAVVSCVVVAAGAVLYDAVAVRTGHATRAWRASLEDELATRTLDDTWVLVGAGVAVVLGFVLCWAAFAPGLRRWLPLRRPGAVVHRTAIAALIAARAADLVGVERCTVKVRRHRTRAVVTGPADPAEVQRELRAELARVALAGPHRLDVRHRAGRPEHPHDRRHGHRRLAQEAPR